MEGPDGEGDQTGSVALANLKTRAKTHKGCLFKMLKNDRSADLRFV